MSVLLSLWHLYLTHSWSITGYATYLTVKRTPLFKRYRKRLKDQAYARKLCRPGLPDENGWRPRTNYERR